jgi:4-nitrophenyl phosphatase
MERLLSAGIPVFFITNNSTRTPEATAEKIVSLTGVDVGGDHVLTSGQAAITMLERSDDPVHVVGEEGLRAQVLASGFSVSDDPLEANSVVVGLTRDLSYETVHKAMTAVRNGARFVATNDDTTFPTEDGLAPGCGAIVAAIAAAAGDAWVVGDRLDTDIALVTGEDGWRSVLVLTGVTDRDTAANAEVDHVVDDFPAAVDLVLRHFERS